MGPKIEGKALKKGRRGGKKPKALKLRAEDIRLNKGNLNMGDEAQNEKGADLPLLNKPVETSVTGVHQLLKIFQNTTVEMRDLLSTECDLVYECKVCRSLYRSVANFLSHKRSYCKEQFSDTRHVFPTSHRVEDQLVVIQPEPVPAMPCSETWKTSDSVLTSHAAVSNAENNNPVTAEIKGSIPPISSYRRPKRNLDQIVEELANKLPNDVKREPVEPVSAVQFYTSACEKILVQKDVRKEQTLHLEPVEGTSCVYQTVIPPASSIENTDLMKTQVTELHGMITANEATLGPVGEITVINGEGETLPMDTSLGAIKKAGKRKCTPSKTKTGFACNICHLDFETRKTFVHHNNIYHATSRVHYPCPCCRDTFANAWNVYRHLYKVHRKSSAQVRRLRPKVLSKVYLGKVVEHETQYMKKKSKTVEPLSEAEKAKQEQERIEKENEDWMQNLEDDLGLQMCGGCGRRFERRAALNSHSQTCAKRIEVRKKANRFYPISTVGSSSNVQNSSIKVPLFMERAHSSRSEMLIKTDLPNTENISSRLTPVSTHSESTMSSGAKSGNSPAHSPVPHESSFSVPIPPVPATRYLRGQNNNGNPEKKIEIQIRRNYFKTEKGSVSRATILGSAGSGPSHSLGKPGYRGTFPIEASTSGRLLEATPSSFQQKISVQGNKSLAFEKDIFESSMPLKLENIDEDYEMEESKAHLSSTLGLGSSKHLSSCVAETSSSECSKPSMKLNQSKEIKKCHLNNEDVEDGYEQVASKMSYWRNYPSQNEYPVEKFEIKQECIVKDEVQDNELASEYSLQKNFVGEVEHNLGTNEAGVGSSESTISNNGEQIIKVRRVGRKAKHDCYIKCMMNGKKKECILCHRRYNKVACRKRQVAAKIGYYSYRCMLCDSRYLSRALCLAHITDQHNIPKILALFHQKCVKIILNHSKALRLRSARVQRTGKKSSDSDADLSIILGKAAANANRLADTEECVKILAKKEYETEESNASKQTGLSKERCRSKIQTNDKNCNQNLVLFGDHCGVRRTRYKEYKELAIEDSKVTSVSPQKKKSTNRSILVESTEKNDTDPKEEDSYTLLDPEDRRRHCENEVLVIKSKPLMHTSRFDSDLIFSKPSIQERQSVYPEWEEDSIKGIMEHEGTKKVENCKESAKRRLTKAKNKSKGRKCVLNEKMDPLPAFDEKYKHKKQSNSPDYQNSPGITLAHLERKAINTMDNTAAGTSKQKEVMIQNASVSQHIFLKALGGKAIKTESTIRDDIEDNRLCDEVSENYKSHKNGGEKRSLISKTIKLNTEMGTFDPYSNYSDEIMTSEETCQLVKQVPCMTKRLSSKLMMLAPLRKSRRLSGQKPDTNTEQLLNLMKRTNCQNNRNAQDRSSCPNTVILAKKCRTSTRGNLVNVGNHIACLNVKEVVEQNVNLNCETDFPRDPLNENCNGSVAKDDNCLLPMNSDYAKEVRADNERKLRKTKSKQRHLQSLGTIKKFGSNVGGKPSCCLKGVSDFENNRVKNLDENCLNREEARAEGTILKNPYSRPPRKGKIRLHNPADLPDAKPKLNGAESVGTSKMENQAILSQESGVEIPNDFEPPVREINVQEVGLKKLVMEVIFGTGQDCDTTQQLLAATLKGTKYEVKYSPPSSSAPTSPSPNADTPAFFLNDMAVSEEAVKTKNEGKIMTHKNVVLNPFPEKKQRPVRNRIKLEREDFIYDLPDRCRDTKRENDDRLSSSSSVTRSGQQTELAGSSMASSSDSTAQLKNIPKLVLVRTNSLEPATKTENDNTSSTEDLVGASEILGRGSVAYKVSKRKSHVQDAKCKLVASNKERTD